MDTNTFAVAGRLGRVLSRAEGSYFAANTCDWLDTLIRAVAFIAAIPSKVPVTPAPLRARLA